MVLPLVLTTLAAAGAPESSVESRWEAMDAAALRAERARLRRRQSLGRSLGAGGALVGFGGLLLVAGTWDPGLPPQAVAGGALMLVGGAGMIAGPPLANAAAMRERRLLHHVGMPASGGAGIAAWTLYAVSLPSMVFFPVGLPLYVGSLVATGVQSWTNHRAATRQATVTAAPRVARTRQGTLLWGATVVW